MRLPLSHSRLASRARGEKIAKCPFVTLSEAKGTAQAGILRFAQNDRQRIRASSLERKNR